MKGHNSLSRLAQKNHINLAGNQQEKIKRLKLDKIRKNELRCLMIIGLIKIYSKQYSLQVEFEELAISQIQQSAEDEALRVLTQMKSKIENYLLICRQKVKILQVSNPTMKQSVNSFFRLQSVDPLRPIHINSTSYRVKHEEQVHFFLKLNLIIDNYDNKNEMTKLLEYLKSLTLAINRSKIILYKYYNTMKMNKLPRFASLLKEYVFDISDNTNKINKLIEKLVRKQQNYEQYLNFRNKNQLNYSRLEEDTQNLIGRVLFYYTCYVELKKILEWKMKRNNLHEEKQTIERLIKQIISYRHIVGYFTKEIVNACSQFNFNPQIDDTNAKDIWRTVYDKKFVSNSFKRRLRLQ